MAKLTGISSTAEVLCFKLSIFSENRTWFGKRSCIYSIVYSIWRMIISDIGDEK